MGAPVVRWTFAIASAVLAGAVTAQALRQETTASGAAPRLLSQTGLYLADGTIDPRNRPYAPQYPLWTDNASKQRWMQLPAGTRIDVSDANRWNFPVGTRFWKEFAFNGRRVETRYLRKVSATRWTFASYAWNADQTEAELVPAEGRRNVAEVAPGKFHSIPGESDCRSCHDSGRTEILGVNALQLSDDRDPNALHADQRRPGDLTLSTLIRENALAPSRRDWINAPPRIDATDARDRSVRGYLSTNCGSCHNRRSAIASLKLFLNAEVGERADCAAALTSTVNQRGHWVIPGSPDHSRLVVPGRPDLSALVARLGSRRPSSQMPAIGSVIVDTAAVDLISEWITAMRTPPTCTGR